MQGMIDDYYGRFKTVVTSNRTGLSDPQLVSTATDGRVLSGEQAKAMGLVDRIGRLEDAIDVARQKSHAHNARVVMYKRPFGYSGSIYADLSTPQPRANVLALELPQTDLVLPRGFYYLWQP